MKNYEILSNFEMKTVLCTKVTTRNSQYDCISGGVSHKVDPRRYQTSETKESQIVNMLFAASASDSVLLQKYLQVTHHAAGSFRLLNMLKDNC